MAHIDSTMSCHWPSFDLKSAQTVPCVTRVTCLSILGFLDSRAFLFGVTERHTYIHVYKDRRVTQQSTRITYTCSAAVWIWMFVLTKRTGNKNSDSGNELAKKNTWHFQKEIRLYLMQYDGSWRKTNCGRRNLPKKTNVFEYLTRTETERLPLTVMHCRIKKTRANEGATRWYNKFWWYVQRFRHVSLTSVAVGQTDAEALFGAWSSWMASRGKLKTHGEFIFDVHSFFSACVTCILNSEVKYQGPAPAYS